MSDESYTESSEESWSDRLGGAFRGILSGLILFLVAFPLLFWNEIHSVRRYRNQERGERVVIPVRPAIPDPVNDGQLVHVTGPAMTPERLTDPAFRVSAVALSLLRDVEMYQWQERQQTETEQQEAGGGETKPVPAYERVWSDEPIPSMQFAQPDGHRNPTAMPYTSHKLTARHITVGGFELPRHLVDQIVEYQPFPVTEEVLAHLPASIREDARIHEGGIYIGENPSTPEIGDLQVRFRIVPPTTVSIVARQNGNTFAAFPAENGDDIEILQAGSFSADTMFQSEGKTNLIYTWMLRAGGFLLMYGGLFLILKPLSVIMDFLPLLGDVREISIALIAFLIAAAFSFLTIALSWFLVRPLLSLGLVLVASTFLVGIRLFPRHPAV